MTHEVLHRARAAWFARAVGITKHRVAGLRTAAITTPTAGAYLLGSVQFWLQVGEPRNSEGRGPERAMRNWRAVFEGAHVNAADAFLWHLSQPLFAGGFELIHAGSFPQ